MIDVLDPTSMAVRGDIVDLIGARCDACGETHFPPQASCRRCGGEDLTKLRLADRGALWSWTVQRYPPPSPPYRPGGDEFEPFALGYVELPGEVIVETRLAVTDFDTLRIGMPMRLTAIEVPAADGTAMTFAFAPAGEGDR